MTTQQSGPLLLRLLRDVRLEIYSRIVLPPFNGCQEYAGLWSSCRQLKEEIECEATRQLRVYLHKVSRNALAELKDGSPTNVDESGEGHELDSLQIINPSTALGRPVIRINIPFLPPSIKHDWHYQDHLVPHTSGQSHHHYQNFNEDAVTRREHDRQKEMYRERILKLFRSLKQLHKLHLTSIDMELTVDKNAATQVAEDTRLEKVLSIDGNPRLLGATVLGRLLDMYMRCLTDESDKQMRDWDEDWAFNTTTIHVAWNFRHQKLATHDPVTIHFSNWQPRVWDHISTRASCTEDRRQGKVQVMLDVNQYIQKKVSDMKSFLRKLKDWGHTGRFGADWQVRYDEMNEQLAKDREKLQRLGITEGGEPELDAFDFRLVAEAGMPPRGMNGIL